MSSVKTLQQAPLTSAEARQQAQAEDPTLLVADNKTGYFGVRRIDTLGLAKPYQARLTRGGKQMYLGYFATAEEAALCVARSRKGEGEQGQEEEEEEQEKEQEESYHFAGSKSFI